jgi:hypothetical protein
MSGSIRPPFPSAPSDPALRRLGIGAHSGNARPLRAQLIVVIVLGLMLLAVPLYLWRRPAIAQKVATDAGAPGGSASAAPSALPAPAPATFDAGALEPERVKLSQIRRVRCGATVRQASDSESCDSLPYFEKALADAVKSSVDCVPRSPKSGSINFVLEIDFTRKSLHVFPGASGDWRGPKARRATKCVNNALAAPDWATIVHQHRYYAVAVMATFAGAATEPASATSRH